MRIGDIKKFEDMVPLYLVRIATNMSVKDFADVFMVTRAYIDDIENGKKRMNKRTIRIGMNDLGSSYEEYQELEEVCKLVAESKLSEDKKYALGLMKALSTLDAEIKDEVDETLEKHLGYKSR